MSTIKVIDIKNILEHPIILEDIPEKKIWVAESGVEVTMAKRENNRHLGFNTGDGVKYMLTAFSIDPQQDGDELEKEIFKRFLVRSIRLRYGSKIFDTESMSLERANDCVLQSGLLQDYEYLIGKGKYEINIRNENMTSVFRCNYRREETNFIDYIADNSNAVSDLFQKDVRTALVHKVLFTNRLDQLEIKLQ